MLGSKDMLVESRIRYLPLYPDDDGAYFNEAFFGDAPNLLAELLPDFADLAAALKVIDVSAAGDGRIMRVHLNADLDEALAFLAEADSVPEPALDCSQTRLRR